MAVIGITCAVDAATYSPAAVMDSTFYAVGTVVAAFASAATSWSTAALAARACNFAGFLIDCTTGAVNSVASLTAVSTLARLPTGITFSALAVAPAVFARSFGVRTADC